jgi:hypothetical protein
MAVVWGLYDCSHCDKLRSNGDGLTCHVDSVSHSKVILVKRGCLGGISEMFATPLGKRKCYVCKI